MKKLMVAVASAMAVGLVAQAAEWFNGGIADGWPESQSMFGGSWSNTTGSSYADSKVTVSADESAPLTFEATDTKTLANDKVAITSALTFTPFDGSADLPAVPTDAKAGVIAYGGFFYVLAKGEGEDNVWTKTDFEATENANVIVTFADGSNATYQIGENTTNVTIKAIDTVSKVCMSGDGAISALTSTAEAKAVVFTIASIGNATVTEVVGAEPQGMGQYSAKPGTTVTVTYTADSGYFFAGGSKTSTGSATAAAGEITPELEVAETEVAAAKIGDTDYYTLAAAFAGAKDSDTIALLKDIALGAPITNTAMAVTFDMGGFTLSSTVIQPITVVSGGELTITGNGTINGPTNGQAYDGKCVVCVDGGTLTYLNGTLTATGEGSDGMYGVYVLNGGTATFGDGEGGPSITTWFAAIGANNTTAPCTITVNNGTYTQKADGTSQWWHYFCAALYAPAAGTYTINGGTFDGALYCVASRYVDAAQTITFNNGTFSDPLYVDEEPGATTGTRTITKLSTIDLAIVPADKWEWKGTGSSNYVALQKKSDTPTIPEEQGAIVPVPGEENTYVVSNATDTVDISNLPADATVKVDSSVTTITGVTDTDQIKVVAAATNETTEAVIDITTAFTITPGTGTSATIVLNPEGSVQVQIGEETPETINVTPELSGEDDTVKPLVISDTTVGVGVKTIPGLTYQILKSTTPDFKSSEPVGDPIAAKGTRLALEAAKGEDPAAFYKVQVTK